jgi:PAS domain S-box-containing protein
MSKTLEITEPTTARSSGGFGESHSRTPTDVARILVVDDIQDTLDLFSILLEQAGYEVLTATTAHEGLQIVREQKPDLVLLDVMLPDMSGIEVCSRIKADLQTAAVLVVHVSGSRTSAENEVEGLDAGADGYLTKPIEPPALLAHVNALLRIKRTEQALHESVEEFRAAFSNALDAMLIVDDDSTCIDANPAACVLFGSSRDEMLNKRMLDFAEHGLNWDDIDSGWRNFLTQGEQTGEFRLYLSNQSARDVEYRAKANFLPNRHLWVLRDVSETKKANEALLEAQCKLEDRVAQRTAELVAANSFLTAEIGQRKRAQEALAERLRFETLLAQLSANTAHLTPDSVDKVIEYWLRQLVEFLGIDRAVLACFDEDGNSLTKSHAYNVPEIKSWHALTVNKRFPWSIQQLKLGRVLCLPQLPDDLPIEADEDRQYVVELGIKSNLSIPSTIGGSVVCVLALTSVRAHRDWPDEIVKRLQLVGEIFANAIVRKRAQNALRESEKRFRVMADTAPVMIWMTDPEARGTFVNQRWLEFTGRVAEEELGHGWTDRIHPDDSQRALSELSLASEARREFKAEYRALRQDGQYRWLLDTGIPRSTAEGDFAGYIGSALDITEMKQAEEALRQINQTLRTLIEASPLAIVSLDLEGKVKKLNPEAERLFGWSEGEALNTFLPFLPEDRRTGFLEFVPKGEVSKDVEVCWQKKGGLPVHISLSTAPIRDPDGAVNGLMLVIADIGERKEAEEARTHLLQRLVTAQEDERRRLSRELHDQMGQSLAALILGLKWLGDSVPLEPVAEGRLQKLKELTTQLAQDAHSLARDLRPTALDDFGLHTALSNYVEEWAERAQITADFHSNGLIKERLPPHVETAVYRSVQEALTNVLKHSKASNVSVIVEHRSHRVLAIVEDDGCGFEADKVLNVPQNQRRLGLLGMEERVALVGGTLNIESTPGAGTTILLSIPV